MDATDDAHELNESLKKSIQQTKVTTEYLKRKIEEKSVRNRRGYTILIIIFRQAQINENIATANSEAIKDLQQIQNDVEQLIEENELLKKQQKPSKLR